MDHKELFKILDEYVDSNLTHLKSDEPNCCKNPEINLNENGLYNVCYNCGRITPYFEEILPPNYLNPNYQMKTYIKYNSKHRHLWRINNWELGKFYKENTAHKSYLIIKGICEKYELCTKVIDKACYIYKTIYIDNNITSRSNIKMCVFILCIKRAATHNNVKLNVNQVLQDYNLSLKNYTDAIHKIKHLKII